MRNICCTCAFSCCAVHALFGLCARFECHHRPLEEACSTTYWRRSACARRSSKVVAVAHLPDPLVRPRGARDALTHTETHPRDARARRLALFAHLLRRGASGYAADSCTDARLRSDLPAPGVAERLRALLFASGSGPQGSSVRGTDRSGHSLQQRQAVAQLRALSADERRSIFATSDLARQTRHRPPRSGGHLSRPGELPRGESRLRPSVRRRLVLSASYRHALARRRCGSAWRMEPRVSCSLGHEERPSA